MKKSILMFIAFCLAFFASLGFIAGKADPSISLPEAQSLEWHGHIENEYGTYNGTILNDMFSGHGDFAFITGETYTGEWSESFMSGNGSVVFPEVGEYTGSLAESKRNGIGTFTWYMGDVYQGSWVNDAMSGEGIYTFSNGCVLNGIFENNTPISGTISYKVALSEDTPDTEILEFSYTFSDEESHITFITKGGLKYDGDVSGLYSNGKATIVYPSGNEYTGSILAGKRNGTGTYSWKNVAGKTVSYYEGDWKNDHMNGKGQYHYSGNEYPYLTGTFENDIPTGTLTYYKAAGNTFRTTWSNGSCIKIEET